MATDVERLVVSLEASITKYEKAMNKAVSTSQQTSRKIEKNFAGLDKSLSGMFRGGFSGLAQGAVAGAAGFLSLEAVIQGTTAALEKFGAIADFSARAGLDPEFFQAMAAQAEMAGVSVEQLGGAFSTFAKNVGLAAAGKGKLAAALKELNPELLQNIENATNQEDRIRAVIAALKETSSAAQRVAIATAAFGDAGAGIAAAFADSSESIDETIRKARELGLVVDRDLIAKADEYGDQWDRARKILDLQIMKLLVDLAVPMTALVNLATAIVDQFTKLGQIDLSKIFTIDFQGQRLLDLGVPGLEPPKKPPVEITVPFTPPDTPENDELVFSHNEAADAAKKQAEAVKELIADLQHESELLGMTAEEQEVSNALRKAGAAATAEQRDQITELVETNFLERQQVEALTAAYQQLWEIGESSLNSLIEAMADGKLEGEELLSVISDIAKQLGSLFIKNAFSSMSGGGGFDFASLFTGRAEGGPVSANTPYMVGEKGPELFMPRMAGRIIPKVPAAGGGVTNITIDARGAQAGVAEQIAVALRQFERFRLPGKVKQIGRDPYAVGA